jgi:hypothetical protein
MGVRKIKQRNPASFLTDIRRVSDVMVWAETTQSFIRTTKREVLELAENKTICYYMTNEIFMVKRDVMVIL